MRRRLTLLLVVALVCEPLLAVSGKQAQYIGGTAPITAKAEAVLDVTGVDAATFTWKKGQWQVPYHSVTNLEYGQHAGRRVGLAVAGIATFGIAALPAIFSKKRRHYLTVSYTDGSGMQQAAIFELGKDAIRTTLKILEVRTGKAVEYEDEESQKAGNK